MLNLRSIIVLLSIAHTSCVAARPPGAGRIKLVGTETPRPHPYLQGGMVPERVIADDFYHAQFWSQLSHGSPTRVIEEFRAIPDTLNSQDSELQWLSPPDWERLAVELHAQWRETLSSRQDIQFVEISELPELSDAVHQDNCMDLVGPFSMETLYSNRRDGGCPRHWALDEEEVDLAFNSGGVDGVLTVEILVRRCPLKDEVESRWWTGTSLNLNVVVGGDAVADGESGYFKASGFLDEPPRYRPVDGCIPLPRTKDGRQVDAEKLTTLLSADLHRRVEANLAVLPRMDQPWPVADSKNPP